MAIDISNIPVKKVAEGITGKYIHTSNTTVGYVSIKKGAVLPAHSHIHEQITQIISGELEMTIDGKTEILKPGMVVVIPSNVVHSAVAHSDCDVTDTFYPVREDYK